MPGQSHSIEFSFFVKLCYLYTFEFSIRSKCNYRKHRLISESLYHIMVHEISLKGIYTYCLMSKCIN